MAGPVQLDVEAQGLVQPGRGLSQCGSQEQRSFADAPLLGEDASLEGGEQEILLTAHVVVEAQRLMQRGSQEQRSADVPLLEGGR